MVLDRLILVSRVYQFSRRSDSLEGSNTENNKRNIKIREVNQSFHLQCELLKDEGMVIYILIGSLRKMSSSLF